MLYFYICTQIYCVGDESCQHTRMEQICYVDAVGRNVLSGTLIQSISYSNNMGSYSCNNTLTVRIAGDDFWSFANSSIYCHFNDTCFIYCSLKAICRQFNIYCSGSNILETRIESKNCANIIEAILILPIPTATPTRPPTPIQGTYFPFLVVLTGQL